MPLASKKRPTHRLDAKPRRPQKRALQKRTEDTQAQITAAATDLFSSLGFEAVSIRMIEAAAGVQRGLVAYHFETKEALWARIVDDLFAKIERNFNRLDEVWPDLTSADRTRTIVAAFIRFSAEVPELNRLMVQEGKISSWRMDYIVDTHIKPRIGYLRDALGVDIDAHTYYLLIGAGAFVFSVEYECKRLFGVDPRTPDFIDAHAQMVADILKDTQRRSERNSSAI